MDGSLRSVTAACCWGVIGMNSLAVIYGGLFLCSLVTGMIGIFAIFGAFLLGTVLLMALATTIMTTPMLLRFMRGTELEPFINDSGFGRPSRKYCRNYARRRYLRKRWMLSTTT